MIDETVWELFDLPEDWKLLAETPFGGIIGEWEPKVKEKIEERVKFYRRRRKFEAA